MTDEKKKIKNLSIEELALHVEGMGEPGYRAAQVSEWLYEKRAASFGEMTNLSKSLRERLDEQFDISSVRLKLEQKSVDGTRKLAYELRDGGIIESVLIPEAGRVTLCVSSQVGCALGCRFCLTGAGGFTRNLDCGEIVDQVIESERLVEGERGITSIVFMGMGEPFRNFARVARALRTITSPLGLGFSGRRVTVSTSGVANVISEFGRLKIGRLAVSLNAADDKLRSRIMPINRKHPLKQLMSACRGYQAGSRERLTFEYVLLAGINDSEADAERTGRLLAGIPCKINLILFNECEALEWKQPSRAVGSRFQKHLRDMGYDVFLRDSRGADISAACGQLRGRLGEKEKQ